MRSVASATRLRGPKRSTHNRGRGMMPLLRHLHYTRSALRACLTLECDIHWGFRHKGWIDFHTSVLCWLWVCFLKGIFFVTVVLKGNSKTSRASKRRFDAWISIDSLVSFSRLNKNLFIRIDISSWANMQFTDILLVFNFYRYAPFS